MHASLFQNIYEKYIGKYFFHLNIKKMKSKNKIINEQNDNSRNLISSLNHLHEGML
jgi:hypothetical protein